MASKLKDYSYVIVLDDDPIVAKIVAKGLGLYVRKFSNSKSLIKSMKSLEPVAVFVDVHLGVNDSGIDAIPALRSRWPFVPIIVVTGDERGEMVGNALASGANDFIRKPINLLEMRARFTARVSEMRSKLSEDEFVVGDMKAFQNNRSLVTESGVAYIPRIEFLILKILSQKTEEVVSREYIRAKIWKGIAISDNVLDRKLSNLKSSLNLVKSTYIVKSVYGKGIILKRKS